MPTNFIGDIHGHATALKQLLSKLGYQKSNGVYKHPDSAVETVFVGDYIDRGPEIPEVLDIVRRMVDDGRTIALMGNHEYNAICYNTLDADGRYLRARTKKNEHQHSATLKQFENNKKTYEDYIAWFKTLPLFVETADYRAVHACWDQSLIEELRNHLPLDRLTETTLQASAQSDHEMFDLVDTTLKGKELAMPEGISFTDKDGHIRKHVRIKWWIQPEDKTYQDISLNLEYEVPHVKVDPKNSQFTSVYPKQDKPVFFGHYWLRGNPNLHQGNICCLDYSIAREGYLACYQYNGEQTLDNDKFVWV